MSIPIANIAQDLVTIPHLPDEKEHVATLTILMELRRFVVRALRDLAKSAPELFQVYIIEQLSRSESLSKHLGGFSARLQSLPYRAVQIAYSALLAERQIIELTPNVRGRTVRSHLRLATPMDELAVLSTVIVAARRGERTISLRDGQLHISPTITSNSLNEYAQNVAVASGEEWPEGALVDGRVGEAERVMFGSRVADLLLLSSRDWVEASPDGVLLSELSRVPRSWHRFVRQFILSAARLQHFAAPYFFDLGPRLDNPRSLEEMVEQSGEVMWLSYYPFLLGRTSRQNRAETILTTPPILASAILAASNSKSYMLVRLQQLAAEQADEQGKEIVEDLTELVHRKFEDQLAEVLRQLGLTVITSLDALGGRPLPCGEIDVLAGTYDAVAGPFVVVCEAKNIDVPLMKDFAYENLARTMDRAVSQVARKTAWARSAWPACSDMLGLPQTQAPMVVGIIATRRPVPILLLDGWPGGTVAEVGSVIRDCLASSPVHWRRDVRRGVVGEEGNLWTG